MASPDGGISALDEAGTRGNEQNTSYGNSAERETPQWRIEPIPEEHVVGIPDDVEANARCRKSYASFGDQGTTASVNAYGHIMQISSFLGYGDSGFLSVDLHDTPEPYYVQSRMERLMEISEQPERGIRLETQETSEFGWDSTLTTPSLEFVHDRWPRFTKVKTPENRHDLDFSVQYFCEGGTIFQRYSWQVNLMDAGVPELPEFRFDSSLLVRELDFVNGHNTFNSSEETHACEMTPSQQTLLIFHEKSDHPIPALIVAPFAFGKNQKILAVEDHDRLYKLDLSEDVRSHFRKFGALEITMAYKLESRSAEEPRQDATVRPSQLKVMENTLSGCINVPYQRITFSSHKHLDFIIRRNLEHILSVCSIPVPENDETGDIRWAPTFTTTSNQGAMALALTCGDISGHRVTSSASFYAFQFLISMYEYVSDKSKSPRDYSPERQQCKDLCLQGQDLCETCKKVKDCLQHLQQRIRMVCEGHLHWVYKKTELEGGAFAPHYWVTGKRIPWESNRYMTPRALTDTPFQMLKIRAFLLARGLNIQQNPFSALDPLHPQILSWVQTLEDDDERGKFVFPQPSKDEIKRFLLADHFWIYQALKFIFYELFFRILEPKGKHEPHSELLKPNPYTSRELFPNEPRQTMIRRFITVNPDSKKRTIATARTSTETRFQFHPTDTVLLYAMDLGFFEKPSEKGMPIWSPRALMEEWKTTLDAQGDYEENQTLDWENPLQYGLTLIMGSKKRNMSSKFPMQVAYIAERVLLESTSPNGLFPGLLRDEGEPTIFQDELDRDSYWHATFEIPHILWNYARDVPSIPTKYQEKGKSGNTNGQALRVARSAETGRANDGHQAMRKQVPFSNLHNVIDEKGLVEISDDWLLGGSGFLKFGSILKALCFQQSVKKDPPQREDDLAQQPEPSDRSLGGSGAGHGDSPFFSFGYPDTGYACQAIKTARKIYEKSPKICDKVVRGTIIEIPKRSDGQEIRTARMMTNENIFRVLAKKRKVKDSKKRLIWLPQGDKVTALMCYLASPQLEQDNMSAFVDRHASYDKFFFDAVAPFQNEWETELHLSYFSLLNHDPGILQNGGTIPYLSYVKVGEVESGVKCTAEATRPKTIVRSTMSFRFVGDFFDRYWTCHVLDFNLSCHRCRGSCQHCSGSEHDYDPKDHDYSSTRHECLQKSLQSLVTRPGVASFQDTQDGGRKKNPWQQRKVLELLLFDEMLKRIKLSTGEILDWVRDAVSDGPDREGDFMSSSWPQLRESLETDALPGNSSHIDIFQKILKDKRANLPGAPFQLSSTYPLNSLAEALQGDIQSKELKGSDGYFSQAKLWRFFETILQTVEDDLDENLEKIEEWSRREEERGLQKPRWTRNDERRYGSIIKTLQFQNRREIHELQRLRSSIKAFREPRSSKLSSLRDDINFLGSENINLFTYVTVVFLPLGFATGIFSMSSVPDTPTLISMVITAAVALYLTIGALVNAKPLRKFLVDPVIQASDICAKKAFYYPVYVYLRYLYHPAATTEKGSGALKWYENLRDRTKRMNVFEEAKRDYRSRTDKETAAKKDPRNGDKEENKTRNKNEPRISTQSEFERQSSAGILNGKDDGIRTKPDPRTENQRISPPVDLENGDAVRPRD